MIEVPRVGIFKINFKITKVLAEQPLLNSLVK